MHGSPVLAASMRGVEPDLGTLNSLINNFSAPANNTGLFVGARRDGVGGPSGLGQILSLADRRQSVNTTRADAFLQRLAQHRGDGYNPNAGTLLARQAEFMITRVLTEEFPLPTAMKIFGMGDSVPVGANTYKIRRQYEAGEAEVWRGRGTQVPRSSIQQREEDRSVRHLVSGYGWDLFEAATMAFAGVPLSADLARVSRDAILKLANKLFWGIGGIGQAHGIYGVLDYPWIPKRDMGAGVSLDTVKADPDHTLGQLHELAGFPSEISDDVYEPDTLIMTRRVHRVLSTVRFAAGSDTTILQHFMENSDHITRVEIAHELKNAGGPGIDAIIAARTDARGIRLVMPQGVTQLPVETRGFSTEVYNYASIGGVTAWDPLNNVIGYWNTTT